MSESLEMTGKVAHVSETETFGSGFQKRFIVLEVDDNGYKNHHGFQLFNDKVGLLDGFQAGDTATVMFNAGTCREYKGKWFADMHRAWKVTKVGGEQAPQQQQAPQQEDAFGGDDIPF